MCRCGCRRSACARATRRRRSGRGFKRHPGDILITTPESLYLLLTTEAGEALRSVETVIVDEIHALVPTKRGAHMALSLERLEALVRAAAGGCSGSGFRRRRGRWRRWRGFWAERRRSETDRRS